MSEEPPDHPTDRDSEAGSDPDSDDPDAVDDPFAELTDAGADSGVDDPLTGGDSFAELDVPDADPEEDFFEEMETADLDEEAVWESVFEEPATVEPGSEEMDGADAVVRTEQYCKKCEYFSEPPELACDNPGTEIVEVVGVEEFQLRNCPVVAARRQADTVFPDEG